MNINKELSKGFTLIEIMVALMIFSILSLLVSQALTDTVLQLKQNDHHNKQLLDFQIGINILQNDLEQVTFYQVYSNNSTLENLFYHNKKNLRFVKRGFINPLDSFERSTLQEVEYDLLDNDLVRTSYNTQNKINSKKIVLRDILNISWKFIGPDKNNYELWPPIEDWREIMPSAIILNFQTKEYGNIEKIFLTAYQDEFIETNDAKK